MKENLVEMKSLEVSFYQEGKLTPVVRGVSFNIKQGEILGLVGESGCGKSITSRCIMRLVQEPPGKVSGGEIFFDGEDVLKMKEKELRSIRGKRIGMIFQEPMTSLNPLFTCGDQIMEAIMQHMHMKKPQARERAIEMLRLVGVPSPEKRIAAYPHELSGGMRQRVMIAMALSCDPELLIADEPTTALDPTIQAQILRLVKEIQQRMNMSVLLITHDLGIVAENCDRVAVMYAGQIIEIAPVKALFGTPMHPYTMGLLKAIPKMNDQVDRLYSIDGTVPMFTELPEGCAFGPRCPYYTEECKKKASDLVEVGPEHSTRCVRIRDIVKSSPEQR